MGFHITGSYGCLHLPMFDGMAGTLKKANEIRAKNLEQKKTDEAKEKRITWKSARVQEQEERKLWIQRQNVHHTYDSDDEEDKAEDDEAENDNIVVNMHTKASSQSARSDKKCKCGSTEHRYTSHHKCPLNKDKKQPCVGDDSDSTTESCDSDTGEVASIFAHVDQRE